MSLHLRIAVLCQITRKIVLLIESVVLFLGVAGMSIIVTNGFLLGFVEFQDMSVEAVASVRYGNGQGIF